MQASSHTLKNEKMNNALLHSFLLVEKQVKTQIITWKDQGIMLAVEN